MTGDPRNCGPVLIVDDDASLRALVARLLEGAGYATSAAASGEQALAWAAAARPRAVVLDVRLPGISGYEVCRELRGRYGDALPILFVSGERVESFDRVAGLLLGADDYLVKPFAPDELLVRVAKLIGRRASAANGSGARLTDRELQVLRLLADGRRQPEIAGELVISPKTVGTHVERILGKLGAHSRAQAVALAYRDRLLEG
jgi:two-component system nitrate/nitrite response regulator NarL